MGINDLEKLAFDHPGQCDVCGGDLEYKGIGRYQCMECGRELLDDYGKIKKYFEKHGPAPVSQIAKDTGISRDKINILLKRGTAEIPVGTASSLRCEKCGMAIRYGRYCTVCSNTCFGEEIGERVRPAAKNVPYVRKNFGNYTRNKT